MLTYKVQPRGKVSPGISTCQGCMIDTILRNVLDVLGDDTVLVIPPGCAAQFSGCGPEGSVTVAGIQGNLENTAAIASGLSNGFKHQGNEHTIVVGFAGDGGTVDIGLQSLSGAMERNDNFIYICYDNEAYMNTGIQGSSSTPFCASTTTTPAGKPVNSKDFLRIVMAHNVPYAASASVANIPDLRRKVEKAKNIKGCRVLHVKFVALGIGKYQKNMKDIFEILMTKGNPKLAIRYAKRIIKDGEGKTPTEIAPGTKVYELVEELAKYLPEEIVQRFKD